MDFISAKFIMVYPCVSSYILLYMHGPAILHISQIQTSAVNFLLEHANKYFFLSVHSPLKIPRWYLMAM